jgi:hypothetical protein
MIRQANTQTYVKVFYNVNLSDLYILNKPETPYYSYYKSKLIKNNNNNNNKLIYGK